MAATYETGIPDVASIAISLREITICLICKEIWRDPRYIPICDHTFCLPCLSIYTEQVEGAANTHHCPTCRKEFSIPEGGVVALPKSHLHQQMLDALKEQKEGVQQKEDASSNGNSPRLYCQWHSEEELKLYCLGCNKPVCFICYAIEHTGHKVSAMKDAKQAFIDKIKDNIATTDERVVNYKKAFQQGEVKIKKRICSLEIQQKLIVLQKAELEREQMEWNKMGSELKKMLGNQSVSMTLVESEIECDIIVCETAKKLLCAQAEIFKNTAEHGSILTKFDQIDGGFTPDVVEVVSGCRIQLSGSVHVEGVSASQMSRDFAESKKLLILTTLCDEIRTQDDDTDSCNSEEQYDEEQVEKNDLFYQALKQKVNKSSMSTDTSDLISLNNPAIDVPYQAEELNLIEDGDLDCLDIPVTSDSEHERDPIEPGNEYFLIGLREDE